MKITVDIEVETRGEITQETINDFVTDLFYGSQNTFDVNTGSSIKFDNSKNDKVVQRFVQY